MNTTKPNVKLLKRTLNFIKRNPEKHDQGVWCGTAKCFAGLACHLDGWRPTEDAAHIDMFSAPYDLSEKDKDRWETELVAKGSTVGHVRVVAMSLLGLSKEQSYALFAGCNSLQEIGRVGADICNEAE